MKNILRISAIALTLLVPGVVSAQATPNLEPIPGYYQDPGLSPNRDYITQNSGEHIDPFTGKLQFHQVDLFVPGMGGMDLKIQRSYSSGDGFLRDPSPNGMGWTIGFGRVIRRQGTGICYTGAPPAVNPVLELADGSRQILYPGDNTIATTTQFVTENLWTASCATSSANLGLIVLSPDGTEYDMTTMGPTVGPTVGNQQIAWYVTKITDRNGNWLAFTYNTFPLYMAPATITSSDGRTVTFAYNSNNALSTITFGSHVVTYTSHQMPNEPGYFYLDSVELPDLATKWGYKYNETVDGTAGAGSMNQVTYPGLGTYSYTYNLVTFNSSLPPTQVISKKTGDAGTWTFSYTPATQAYQGQAVGCGTAAFDETAVTGPDGLRLYCFIGYNSIGSTAGSGYIYAIGHQVSTEVGPTVPTGGGTAVQIYGNAVQPLQITSSQYMGRPGNTFKVFEFPAEPITFQESTNLDGANYTTNYSNFDQYGNPGTIAETGPLGDTRSTVVTYHIDPTKWILHMKANETPTVDSQLVGLITRTFDGNSNVLTETKYGVETLWTYDTSGNIASKQDALGNLYKYSSYKLGIAQAETHPQSVTISRVVDNYGNVTSATDGVGATTTYTYDPLNRVASIQHPATGSNLVSITWSPTSRLVTRGNFKELTNYDAFGREITRTGSDTTAGTSIAQTFAYDSVSRKIFSSDPNSAGGTRTVYDILARPTEVFFACASGTDSTCGANIVTEYLPAGKQVTDERGYSTVYNNRAFGNPQELELLQIVAPDPKASVSITRNGLGQILTVQQAGFTRTYGYNANYYLTSIVNPETGTTTFGRDADGNMTSRQVGTSGTTSYTYDGLNRLTQITYPTGTPSVTRTYYKDDKLEEINNTTSQTSYVYDPDKNLTQESVVYAGQTFTTKYTYNGNDALATLVYGSGTTLTYSPDGFNRPTAVSPYVTKVAYFPNGAIQSMTDGNAVTTTFTQNARLWPSSMKTASSSTGILNASYGYDLDGNLTSIGDTEDPTQNRSMVYDSLGRMITVEGPWGTGGFAYDGQGNLLSQNLGSTELDYTYNATTNLLTSISGTKSYTYGYDVYGDVTNNGTIPFAYNDAPYMTCSNCAKSNEVDYVYDGKGARLSSTPKGGTATYFVYDHAGDLLWETTPSTSLKEYVYLAGKQVAVHQKDLTTTAVSAGATSLTITTTPSTTSIAANGTVTLTLKAQNTGSNVASNVAIVDALPRQLAFVSASSGCAVNNGIVSCAIGTVNAGGTSSVQIVAQAGSTAGSVYNVANVTSSTPNSASQSSSAVTTLAVQ